MRTPITILVKSPVALAILCALTLCSCSKQPTIPPPEAKFHIGEYASVCGTVYEVRLTKSGNVHLYISRDHPEEHVRAICFRQAIPYESLKHFESLAVCVTGIIDDHYGTPQITVTSLNQIVTQTRTK